MCPFSPAISCTLLRNNLHLGCRLWSRGRLLSQDYKKNAGGASDWTSAKRNCGQWLAFFGRPASYGAEATGLIETIIADAAKLEVSTLLCVGKDQPFSDMGRKCGNREAEAVQAEQDAQSSFPPQCSGIDGRAEMGGAFRPISLKPKPRRVSRAGTKSLWPKPRKISRPGEHVWIQPMVSMAT